MCKGYFRLHDVECTSKSIQFNEIHVSSLKPRSNLPIQTEVLNCSYLVLILMLREDPHKLKNEEKKYIPAWYNTTVSKNLIYSKGSW